MIANVIRYMFSCRSRARSYFTMIDSGTSYQNTTTFIDDRKRYRALDPLVFGFIPGSRTAQCRVLSLDRRKFNLQFLNQHLQPTCASGGAEQIALNLVTPLFLQCV
jgi:hypothetical protein